MQGPSSRAVWSAVVAGLAALLLAACGSGSGGTSTNASSGTAQATGAGADRGTIGFSIPQGTDPSLQLIDQGLKAEAGKLGMTVKTTDATLDPNKQLSDLDAFVQQKVSAIVVWAVDSKAVLPALERARKANIPVIAIYALADGPYYTDLVIDGKGIGRSGAGYLAKTLGRGAKVAAIFGPPFIDQFREIAEGFQAGAAAGGLDVVETQVDTKVTSQTAATLTQNFKQRYGSQLQGLFTSTDTQARGALSTVGGSFNPKIVTYAALGDSVKLLGEGKYAAAVYINFTLLGRIAAWASGQAVDGKEIPQKLYIEPPLLEQRDAASVASPAQESVKPYDFTPVQRGAQWYMPMR